MRRVLATLGAAALLLTSAGGVIANAPYRETEHSSDASCDVFDTPLGYADFGGYASDLYGADAWLDVWAGDPYTSDLVLTRDWEAPVSVVFDGGAVSMVIPLLPYGQATVTGTLTDADQYSGSDRFRDGNSWYRSSWSGTAFAFSGTLTLPGPSGAIAVAFGPDGCGGGDTTTVTFATQPHARVQSITSSGGYCELGNDAGGSASLFLGIDSTFVFVDGSATDASGALVGFNGAGDLAADGSASFDTFEYDPATGDALPTTGSVDMTVVNTGQTFDYTLRASNGFTRDSGSLLDVGGALVTSVGTFSLEPCVATMDTVKSVIAPSNGPKPGGRRPANDLPSGAITVTSGYRASLATKGAQLPSEAGYPCLEYPDPFSGDLLVVPVEYTVWYVIAGTGSPVTVDTAGSDYDTVVGVYAGTPDASATVACVDDVPLDPAGRTLQAAATFDTAIGTTYWIQVGGLDESVFGPDPFVPYGTLKIAIR